MSRFTKRVGGDLREIAAQASLSPRPVDELVEQIRADDRGGDAEIIPFGATANLPRRSPVALVAAAAAVVLGLVGLVTLTSLRSEEAPADRPTVSFPSTTPVTDTPTSTVAPRPSSELPTSQQIVDAGTYRSDLGDLSITFDLPISTGLWSTTSGRIAFIDADPDGGNTSLIPSNTRDLEFIRLAGWTSPGSADPGDVDQVGVIEPTDVQRWIDENELDVDALTATTVAGSPATEFDLRADALSGIGTRSCPSARAPCFWFADVSGPLDDESGGRDRDDPLLYAPTVNRFWLIEVDDADPLVVHAAAGLDDEAWLDLVEATTLATLTIDPGAPASGDPSADDRP